MNEDQEKMLLPKDWVWVKLEDVCNIISGKNQLKVTNPLGQYPIYGSSGIFGYADEYICEAGTTIIGRKGTINSPIFVKTKFWNVDTAFGLSVKENYDSKLLYYFCLSFNFHTLDKSTTIPSLAKRDLLTIDIPLPPKPIQQAIVSKIEELFSELDKGIENLRLAQQQLKTYRQSVLKWAFEGKLTNDNVNEDELPKGWKSARLGNVCEKIQDGSHFSPQVQYTKPGGNLFKYITAKNIRNGYMDLTNVTYVEKSFHNSIYPRCNPEYGDVLLTKDGVNTGQVTLNILKEEVSLLSSVCLLKPKKNVLNAQYLMYYIQSDIGNKNIIGKMSGTAIKRIVLKKIKDSEIILAPIEEQYVIIQAIESRLGIADIMEESISLSIQQSEALRQSILKKAFEGKLV